MYMDINAWPDIDESRRVETRNGPRHSPFGGVVVVSPVRTLKEFDLLGCSSLELEGNRDALAKRLILGDEPKRVLPDLDERPRGLAHGLYILRPLAVVGDEGAPEVLALSR